MKNLALVIRWLARVLSLAMVVLAIRFAIGQGTFNPMVLIPEERGVFLALLVMTIAGLLAWRWEVAGGLIVLAGFAGYWYFEGLWPSGYMTVFPLAGCLYLIAWLLEHKPVEQEAVPVTKPKSGKKRRRKR